MEIKSQRNADCMVVAYANIMQIDYMKAKETAFRHGWASTSGLSIGMLEHMLEKKGWSYTFRPDLCGCTVGELAARMPDGVFTVYCASVLTRGAFHVMPGVGGRLLNYAVPHLSRKVLEVFELTRATC